MAKRGEGLGGNKTKVKERERGLRDRNGEHKREARAIRIRLENNSYVKVI